MTGPAQDVHAAWVRSAVERFEGPLTLYAARLLGDPEAARDVVQETFLRLCSQAMGEVDPKLAEWLFTVCRNRATDVLRKEGRMSQLGDAMAEGRASDQPGPDEVVERAEAASRILGLLEGLPRGQREVIRLKFQNDFSYQEISRISGYTVGNVGYLIHVGLKAIRAKLADPSPTQARA